MNNNQQHAPRQPDFTVARNGINAALNEMEYVVNVPAVQDTNQILATVVRIEATLTEVRDTFNNTRTTVDHMDVRLAADERIVREWVPRAAASNHNNLAFVTNSLVHRWDTPLMAFQHATTNQPTPNFPATAGDIANMSAAMINAVLLALGAATDGIRQVKVERLKQRIGLISVLT
jgi:hypothetical protein